MNYEKHYNLLIEKGKNRKNSNLGYTEKHHIIPKSINENSMETVKLTAIEHYIAHFLLYKMYKGTKYKKKMSYALWCMCRKTKDQERYINSHQYENARKIYIKNISGKNGTFYGKTHSDEYKKKMSNMMKELHADVNSVYNSIECKRKISENHTDVSGKNNPMYGKTHSNESKRKISEGIKSSRLDPNSVFNSTEYRNKISEGLKASYLDPNSVFNSTEYKENRKKSMSEIKNNEFKFILPNGDIHISRSPSRFVKKYNDKYNDSIKTSAFWRMKLHEKRIVNSLICIKIRRK